MTTGGREPERLVAGPPPSSPSTRRRRLVVLAVAVLGLAVGVPLAVSDGQNARSAPDPTSPAFPTASSTSVSPPPTRRLKPSPPRVLRRSGPRVTGLEQGDLFARSADTVYRIELASGRITATAADPATLSPVTFLAGRTGAILRPLAAVPGLAVPDGGPARELTGRLRDGGRVLPGPDPDHLWVTDYFDGRSSTLSLTDFEGRPTTTSVRENGYFLPDGRGGLLLNYVDEVWENQDGRWQRISAGTVLATGLHHYLIADCEAAARCSTYRYDRRTRTRRPVVAGELVDLPAGGTLSADGRYVAATTYGAGGPLRAQVVELDSGRVVKRMTVPETTSDTRNIAIWAPDGRRLVGLDAGRVVVFDPATERTTAPDLGLPVLIGLTLRPGSS